jgi:hypothetical protein
MQQLLLPHDQHRCLLFCMVLRHDPHAWKSRRHHDGTDLKGWFVAGTTLHCAYEDSTRRRYGLQQAVSYHLPDELWELCQVHEVPQAPPYDGHTSLEVLERLRRDLEGTITRKH